MLSRHLYAILLAFLLQPAAEAAELGTPAFLSNTLTKNTKEKTQDVLEHKPATVPSCEQFVRAALLHVDRRGR